jgi:hypothetical protein
MLSDGVDAAHDIGVGEVIDVALGWVRVEVAVRDFFYPWVGHFCGLVEEG